jgi:hypothetical protein
MTEQRPTTVRRGRTALLFGAWACVGALGAFGIAALLSVGIVLLALAGGLAALLLWRTTSEWVPMAGVGLGAAVPAGYLGWINRDGPGTVCHGIANGVSCTDEWAPWPFYAVALVLAVVSVGVFVYLDRVVTHGGSAPDAVR